MSTLAAPKGLRSLHLPWWLVSYSLSLVLTFRQEDWGRVNVLFL